MFKRFVDLVLSALALILLAPLLIVLAWQVRLKMGGPVLFHQIRPGMNGKPFKMVKFRTMKPETVSVATHLTDSQAITTFGRFLRRTKLDELPQLFNILYGSMTLIGPRPPEPNTHPTSTNAQRQISSDFEAGASLPSSR